MTREWSKEKVGTEPTEMREWEAWNIERYQRTIIDLQIKLGAAEAHAQRLAAELERMRKGWQAADVLTAELEKRDGYVMVPLDASLQGNISAAREAGLERVILSLPLAALKGSDHK